MAYAEYTIRVAARAIVAKLGTLQGTAEELVLIYPESERQPILDQVYSYKPDLKPAESVQQTYVIKGEQLDSTKRIVVKKDDNNALDKARNKMKIDEVVIYRGESFCKVRGGMAKVTSNHAEYEIVEI